MLRDYRSDIDGLRAVAVIPVMLYHAGVPGFAGGYVGVDIFFVISGYLITAIICREANERKFSFLSFYERRARRILPALYFVLLVCWVPAWFLMVPEDFILYGQTALGTLGFVANIVLWQELNYFSPDAETIPLIHMWSLSVEEQFYLLLPIALIFSARFLKGAERARVLLLPTAVASFIVCQYLAETKPSANYYLLPTRAWELLIGSLLALRESEPSRIAIRGFTDRRPRDFLAVSGLAMIAFSIVWMDKTIPFPSFWALLPTLGTALVIANTNPGGVAHWALSRPLLVGIGLISFSAYLWHQPVYAFIRLVSDSAASKALFAGLLLSLLLAFLSWRFVEKPFRSKKTVSTRQLWISACSGSFLILSLGTATLSADGFPGRFELPKPLSEGMFDLPKSTNGWCFYSVDTDEALEVGPPRKCLLGTKTSTQRAILFGDSFAGMYEPFWDEVGKASGIQIEAITTNWCYPSFGRDYAWHMETRAYPQCLFNREAVKQKLPEIDLLIVAAPWSTLQHRGRLADAASTILDAAKQPGLKIIVMPEPVRYTGVSIKRAVYMNGQARVSQEGEASRARAIQYLNERFDGAENIHQLTEAEVFASGRQQIEQPEHPVSLDGQHISTYGSLWAARAFIQSGGVESLLEFLKSDEPVEG